MRPHPAGATGLTDFTAPPPGARAAAQLPAARLPMVAILAVACVAGCGDSSDGGGRVADLVGTSWLLDRLGDDPVVQDAVPTLDFPEPGRAVGSASCNRFNGPVEIAGETMRFGPLVATRMACGDEVDRQETRYLAALQAADRFDLDGSVLTIRGAEATATLRFRADPSAPAGPAAARPRATADRDLRGVWTVTGHWLAAVAAMDDATADEWDGRTLRLVDWEAQAPGGRCADPSYRTERLEANEFVDRFDSWPPDLVMPVSGGGVEVMTTLCEGETWAAPGSTMIRLDGDHAIAPWDGVFFRLERDAEADAVAFRATGNEPGWLLELTEGERIRFQYDYGESEAITSVPVPERDAATGAVTYHAVTEAADLRLEIRPEPCTDDMSGFPFPASVTVVLGDRTFRGCGGPSPAPPG